MSYRLHGAVSSSKILDADNVPNSLLAAVLRAVKNNEAPSASIRYPIANLADYIAMSYKSRLEEKIDDFYAYGRDHHPDGLPKTVRYSGVPPVEWFPSNYTNNDQIPPMAEDTQAVRVIIEEIEGTPIRFIGYEYNRPNPTVLAVKWIKDHSGYAIQPYTDQFYDQDEGGNTPMPLLMWKHGNDWCAMKNSTYSGTTLTIKYGTSKGVYGRWGPPGQFEIRGTDEYGQPNVVIGYEWRYYTIPNFDTLEPYVTSTEFIRQALYYLDTTNALGVFLYNPNLDNTYPTLEEPSYDTLQTCYPFVMFYDNSKSVVDGFLGDKLIAENTALLKKIGIDFKDFAAGLHDPDDPSAITKVTDAFMVFAVDINTDTQEGLAYLYEAFRQMHYEVQLNTQADWIANGDSGTDTNWYFFGNHRAEFTIRYQFSMIEVKTGDVTDSQTEPDIDTLIIDGAEIDPTNDGSTTDVNGVLVGKVTSQIYIGTESDEYVHGHNSHKLVLRKQLTETTFVELTIYGLDHWTKIRAYSKKDVYKGTTSVISTLASGDLTNGKLFLPLVYEKVAVLHDSVMPALVYDSLLFVAHAVEIQYIKWYEHTGFWNMIRVVLFVATFGSSETWIELLYELVLNYIINIAISVLFQVLVEAIGGEAALILAAIAAVYSFYMGDDGDLLFELIDAETLMQAATYMIGAVNAVTADNFKQLQRNIEEHTELQESRQEELEAMEDLLGPPGTTLEVYELISNEFKIDTYETPEQFFNRSCHITNPGVLSLDTIDSYIGNNLTLPKMENNPLHRAA